MMTRWDRATRRVAGRSSLAARGCGRGPSLWVAAAAGGLPGLLGTRTFRTAARSRPQREAEATSRKSTEWATTKETKGNWRGLKG